MSTGTNTIIEIKSNYTLNLQEIKDKFYEYKSLKFYSDMYSHKEDKNMAIDYLNKCIDIAKNLEDKKILGDLYIELGKLYSNISKEKELECYQNGVRIYGELNII